MAFSCSLSLACGGAAVEPFPDGEHDLGTGGFQESEIEPPQGLRPFHVAVFAQPPEPEEIEREFQEFMRSQQADGSSSFSLNPTTPRTPALGQKLVTITAVTADIKDAGTDEAKRVYFTGYWLTDSGTQYYETFILNNPDVDDLDRGKTNVFYYLMNLNNYVPGAQQDQFIKGRIGNTYTDGWFCQSLSVADKNNRGTIRTQSLPFNQWVDYPSPSVSNWMAGNDTHWMSYY